MSRRRRGAGALALAVVPLMPAGSYAVDRGGALPQDVKDVNGSVYVDMEHRVIHAPEGVKMNRRELAHEIGHVFRSKYVSPDELARAARIVGAPAELTDRPNYGRMSAAEEWFADYYAAAASGDRSWKRTRNRDGSITGGSDFTYARVTPRRMRRFRRLLDEIGERENLGFGPLGKPRSGMTGANPIERVG